MIKLLFKVIFTNLKNKYLFFKYWRKNSKEIKNWFKLYLITNSLILELAYKFKIFKNIIDRFPVKVKFNDGLIFYSPYDKFNELHIYIFMYSIYISDFLEHTGKILEFSKEDSVIDIGGHVGTFALFFKHFHPSKLYVYEANINNYCLLKKNFEVNSIPKGEFKIENNAVFGENKVLNFSIGNTSTVGSINEIGFYRKKRGTNTLVSVLAKTLDSVFEDNKINRCKLLKMDIEGSEYSVFEATSDETFAKIDNMVIEVHPTFDKNPADLSVLLKLKGFNVIERDYGNGCFDFFCIRD